MTCYTPIEIDITANNLVYIARGEVKFTVQGNEYVSELELEYIDIYTDQAEICFLGLPLKRQVEWIKKLIGHEDLEFTTKEHYYINLKL